jgi:hypothetical protein
MVRNDFGLGGSAGAFNCRNGGLDRGTVGLKWCQYFQPGLWRRDFCEDQGPAGAWAERRTP